MKYLFAVIAIAGIAAACAPAESAAPDGIMEKLKVKSCLTHLKDNDSWCTPPRISKAVTIYKDCILNFEMPDGPRVSAGKAGCQENKEWIMAMNSEVAKDQAEREANAAKEAASNALKARISKCLSSTDGMPVRFHRNAFDDLVMIPHPDCEGVLDQAQSAYMSRKRSNCNSAMNRYSSHLSKGDYYRARGSLDSAVDYCN